ncbi:MAG: HipA domain-containing protein [Bacteroidales bacterium]|nr:HipA domain-containing protein [Bacteroidales bacterium]
MNPQEINVCPALLTEGHTSYSPPALKRLFDGRAVSHILSFDPPSSANTGSKEAVSNAGRLSLSGAQPKFGLVLGDNNLLRYSQSGEQSTYILKPRPTGYQIINHDYCAANEHLTMQMASQVYGIETAANGLCFFPDGQMAYITRRFDVHPGGKYAQEDFASLMGLTKANGGSDYKYNNGSYEECADIIKEYVKASPVDILRFFRIILFNFVTLNDDAHLKNFSLLSDGREYHLSPAYDLVNTSLQLLEPRIFALDKGLFKEGMSLYDTRQVSADDFIELGRRIGLPHKLVMQEITRFTTPNEKADAIIRRSFLSEELKRAYQLGYHYRQSMIRPEN